MAAMNSIASGSPSVRLRYQPPSMCRMASSSCSPHLTQRSHVSRYHSPGVAAFSSRRNSSIIARMVI